MWTSPWRAVQVWVWGQVLHASITRPRPCYAGSNPTSGRRQLLQGKKVSGGDIQNPCASLSGQCAGGVSYSALWWRDQCAGPGDDLPSPRWTITLWIRSPQRLSHISSAPAVVISWELITQAWLSSWSCVSLRVSACFCVIREVRVMYSCSTKEVGQKTALAIFSINLGLCWIKAVFFQLLFVLCLNFSMHCIFLFFMQKNLFETRTLKVNTQSAKGREKREGQRKKAALKTT